MDIPLRQKLLKYTIAVAYPLDKHTLSYLICPYLLHFVAYWGGYSLHYSIDVKTAALLLHRENDRIYYLIKNGRLLAKKNKEREWRISKKSILNFLEAEKESANQIADDIGLHRETVRRLIREGKISGHKDGKSNRWIIDPASIKSLIKRKGAVKPRLKRRKEDA